MIDKLKAKAGRFIRVHATPPFVPASEATSQKVLSLLYRTQSSVRPTRLCDAGFKVYSQTDEDGILLYLLSMIGLRSRFCVEICAGVGRECNTANLIINHGFHGLLVDGDKSAVEKGKEFFTSNPSTYVFPPIYVHSWVTRENVNDLVSAQGFSGEIDVLSLDLDGIDYWIWKSLEVISPRIVVLEYNDVLGPDLSVTVPYDADFNGYKFSEPGEPPVFASASLRAYVSLATEKGYRLVGTNTLGFNAFFVRDDVPEEVIPSVAVGECFTHPKVLTDIKTRFARVKDLPWEYV